LSCLTPRPSKKEPVKPTAPLQKYQVKDIKKTETITITQKDLDEALANIDKLSTEIRVVPYFKDGKAHGFKLISVKQGSIFEKMGLRRADILITIDGYLLDIQSSMGLYDHLKGKNKMDLVLERDGQVIKYTIIIENTGTKPKQSAAFFDTKTQSYLISSQDLQNLPKQITPYGTDARVVPYFKNGKPSGLKFLSIKRGSLFEKLGLRRGDTLRSIDGIIIEPENFETILSALKDKKDFSFEITRRGENKTLNYKVVDQSKIP